MLPLAAARRALMAFCLLAAGACAPGATVSFSGYTWEVREGGGGPGPNRCSADNVWVDEAGLHLRIAPASGQWTCAEQFKSGLLHFVNRIRDRRFVAVDEERGIVFAFGFFDHSGGATRTFNVPDGRTVTAGPVQPWTWQLAELFKIEKGKIRKIEAILHRVPYGMTSGWSTWSQGMSDVARDATFE